MVELDNVLKKSAASSESENDVHVYISPQDGDPLARRYITLLIVFKMELSSI